MLLFRNASAGLRLSIYLDVKLRYPEVWLRYKWPS